MTEKSCVAHTVRILLIFSVKATYKTKILLTFYSVKIIHLRKTTTSNSLQACCSNENWSKFCKFSFYQMLCRTKPHIWSLGPKIHNKSLVINLTFQRNCDFYWLWSFVGNIINCLLLSKSENLRHVHHENSEYHAIRR